MTGAIEQFEFFKLVQADLRLRHVPFDSGALRDWLSGMWPHVASGDLASDWASEFLAAVATEGEATAEGVRSEP